MYWEVTHLLSSNLWLVASLEFADVSNNYNLAGTLIIAHSHKQIRILADSNLSYIH